MYFFYQIKKGFGPQAGQPGYPPGNNSPPYPVPQGPHPLSPTPNQPPYPSANAHHGYQPVPQNYPVPAPHPSGPPIIHQPHPNPAQMPHSAGGGKYNTNCYIVTIKNEKRMPSTFDFKNPII